MNRPAPSPSPARASARRCSRLGFGVLTVALVVTFAACGETSDTSTSQYPTTPNTEPAPIAVTAVITDGQFDPRSIQIAVGGSVTWINEDVNSHLIVSTTPNVIQSPLIGKAGSYTRTFSSPGEYPYYCTLRNTLKGTVTVR
jgi:plastocyanin